MVNPTGILGPIKLVDLLHSSFTHATKGIICLRVMNHVLEFGGKRVYVVKLILCVHIEGFP